MLKFPNCYFVLLLMFTAAACSKQPSSTPSAGPEAPVLTAATLGEQTLMSNADFASSEAYSTADSSNGAAQAQICKACHSLQEGGPNMIGPALHGFFGRTVGGQTGFQYSAAMQKVNFVWTPRALDAWLSAPGRFLPGNTMMFPGVMNDADRTDLIAYLLAATADDSTASD